MPMRKRLHGLRRGIESNRNLLKDISISRRGPGAAGELDEARATARAGLALNRTFTIKRYRAGRQGDNPTYLAGRERTLTLTARPTACRH